MAAGERLGGLAPATRAAAQALAAAFDVVVIETVGVGQSETEVAEAADTVAVDRPARLRRRAAVPEGRDHGGARRARGHQGRPRHGRDAARSATCAPRCARSAAATPVLAVSSVPPGQRRRGADRRARRPPRRASTSPPPASRARRLGALADFVAEHGARGLRAPRRPPRGRALPRRAAAGGRRAGAASPRSKPARSLTKVISIPEVRLRAGPRTPRCATSAPVTEPPARSKNPRFEGSWLESRGPHGRPPVHHSGGQV